jgi:hypothetical protein
MPTGTARRWSVACAALLCAIALGCGSDGDSGARGPSPSPSGGAMPQSPTTPGPASTAPGTSTATASPGATDLLLAQQIELLGAGNGLIPRCDWDASDPPARPPTGPGPVAWLSGVEGPAEVTISSHVWLCLRGFAPKDPITLTVSTDGHDFATTVVPVEGPLTYEHEERADTLFRGDRLTVHDIGGGVMQSEMWFLVPPDATREALAASGRITITATAAGRAVSYEQKIALPQVPERTWLDESRRYLLINGFTPGLRVPVGLYLGKSENPGLGIARLVRSIGTVVVPPSRVVVFTIPDEVTAQVRARAYGDGDYCVTVPLETQENCPIF